MSTSSLRDSGGIEQFTMLRRDLDKVRILHCRKLDEVDPSAEQILEPVQKPKIATGRPSPAQRLKRHQEIQIAGRRVEIRARGRPEELQPCHLVLPAKSFDLRTMLFDQLDHEPAKYIHAAPTSISHLLIPPGLMH